MTKKHGVDPYFTNDQLCNLCYEQTLLCLYVLHLPFQFFCWNIYRRRCLSQSTTLDKYNPNLEHSAKTLIREKDKTN